LGVGCLQDNLKSTAESAKFRSQVGFFRQFAFHWQATALCHEKPLGSQQFLIVFKPLDLGADSGSISTRAKALLPKDFAFISKTK